ncbi:urea ABC transporter permease subunit UrtB [Galbitalea soli]|uniref:Urea ABC transporter permease subunit UrtB n=1 Tax=Galbitalea soli TaxID=1268042 RepID=A0A7C9PLD5_9MICO|nr:urea ABC transporter permease subunit UrtB [Galbitalea soli]NEM89951.1 urea ABC transporter permease subunit UrtB [Galbitalea soli]NYJ30657.1 urea transport system permease protein [Galbitalea soli]
MTLVLTTIVSGLCVGSLLLLIALGLGLTFGQMGVINNAHGEFIMIGAYTAYLVQRALGDPGSSLLLSLPVAFVTAGLLGVVLEVTLLRRMHRRPLDTLLVTFGVSLVLQQLARDLFGAPSVNVTAPAWLSGDPFVIAGADVPRTWVFLFALSIGCVLGLRIVLGVTPLGRRIRATVQNRDLAETSGISTAATDRMTFFIGSGLAGVAGVGVTLLGAISPTLGTSYIVNAFLVVVAGGIGQLWGSVVAAFGLGILESFIGFSIGQSTAQALVFLVVVVFLQFRPQGLIALRTRSIA